MRLIDADLAKEMLQRHASEFSDVLSRREKALLIGAGAACIDECPTVDAVPVVRCKDCKHFDENNACYCHAADDNGTPIFVREHDFCSYGERRDSDV